MESASGSASRTGKDVRQVGLVGVQAARAKMWDWWDRWDEWDWWDWWEGCPNKGFNTRRYAYLEVTVRDDF